MPATFTYPRDDPDYRKEFDALHDQLCKMLDNISNSPDDFEYRRNVARPAVYKWYEAMMDGLGQRYGLPAKQYKLETNH